MPEFAPVGVQVATKVGPVAKFAHVVAVYELVLFAGASVHVSTSIGPVVTVLQFVVVNELALLAGVKVQLGAGTAGWVTVLQVVARQLLALLAGASVHPPKGTRYGPVVRGSHVTPPPLTQLPAGAGTQFSPRASHLFSWYVDLVVWLVVSIRCDVLRWRRSVVSDAWLDVRRVCVVRCSLWLVVANCCSVWVK